MIGHWLLKIEIHAYFVEDLCIESIKKRWREIYIYSQIYCSNDGHEYYLSILVNIALLLLLLLVVV
jgi:hypothetical protein